MCTRAASEAGRTLVQRPGFACRLFPATRGRPCRRRRPRFLVRSSSGQPDQATDQLRSDVVPQVSKAPSFKAGYWTRATDSSDSNGLLIVIFESEENARAA